jgi:dipeptidyl aminopeptidase/acylaminoacyl peptidase
VKYFLTSLLAAGLLAGSAEHPRAVPPLDSPQGGTDVASFDAAAAGSRGGPQLAISSRPGLGEFFQIYLVNADGTGRTELTEGAGDKITPAWSPDGERLVFARQNRAGKFDLVVMNPDGRGQQVITGTESDDREPTWSSDGNLIAYATRPLGAQDYILAYVRPDGSGYSPFWKQGAGGYAFEPVKGRDPAWSRTGNRLAFTAPYGSKTVIARVRITPGAQHHRLWTDYLLVTCCSQYNESQPSWSPDGKRIAFGSDKIGDRWGSEIFITASDGFVDPHSVPVPRLPSRPTWPPAPADPSSPESWQRVTHKDGDEVRPAWGPERIAFSGARPELRISFSGSGGAAGVAARPLSWAGGWEDIFTIRTDGTVLVNVTDHIGTTDRDPAWRPPHPRSLAPGARDNSGDATWPARRP